MLFLFPLIIFYFCSNVMPILEWIVTPRDANYGGFCPLYFCKTQSGVYLESSWRRAAAAQKPGHSHGSLGLLTRRQILMILTCAPPSLLLRFDIKYL